MPGHETQGVALGAWRDFFTSCDRRERAGCGAEAFVRPGQMCLSDHLVFFWQGELAEVHMAALRNELAPLVRLIEKELL